MDIFQHAHVLVLVIEDADIGHIGKAAVRAVEPHGFAGPALVFEVVNQGHDHVQAAGRVAHFDVAADSARHAGKEFVLDGDRSVEVFEEVVLVDKGNLKGQVVEDEVGFLEAEVAATKGQVDLGVGRRASSGVSD